MPRGKKKVQEVKHEVKEEVTVDKQTVPHGTCASCGHLEEKHTHGPKKACTHACPCLEFK